MHRDADHHAERQAVAPHLDELFDDDAQKRESENSWLHGSSRCPPTRRVRPVPSGWMNTSSSPGSMRLPARTASAVNGGQRRFERGGVVAAHVQRGAERRDLLHAGRSSAAASRARRASGR